MLTKLNHKRQNPGESSSIADDKKSSEDLTRLLNCLDSIGRSITAPAKIHAKPESLSENISKLEKAGFYITGVLPNNLLVITPIDDEKPTSVNASLLENVSVINGNVRIINDAEPDVSLKNLKTINGDATIDGFNGLHYKDDYFWRISNVEFPNLESVGNLTFSSCDSTIKMPKLTNIKGSFTADSTCAHGNTVQIPNIKNIEGDLNIQRGLVESSPAISYAVKGSMNAVPPLKDDKFADLRVINNGEIVKTYTFTDKAKEVLK